MTYFPFLSTAMLRRFIVCITLLQLSNTVSSQNLILRNALEGKELIETGDFGKNKAFLFTNVIFQETDVKFYEDGGKNRFNIKYDKLFLYKTNDIAISAESRKPIIVDYSEAHFRRPEPPNIEFLQAGFVDTLIFTGSYNSLSLRNAYEADDTDSAKVFFDGSEVSSFSSDLDVREFNAKNATFKNLNLQGMSITKRFILDGCVLDKATFDNVTLPLNIFLKGLKTSQVDGLIDLSRISNEHLILHIASTDLTKFKIPYERFDFVIRRDQTYEEASFIYQQLLQGLSTAGLTEKYARYDKLFRKFKYQHEHLQILNFIDKYWWDYGYQRSRVIYISILFFLIFALINIFFAKPIREVYWPENFKTFETNNRRRHGITRSGYLNYRGRFKLGLGMVLYTAYIFWGVKLELGSLEVKNRWALMLILLQYVTGIICLAYIANYIITK